MMIDRYLKMHIQTFGFISSRKRAWMYSFLCLRKKIEKVETLKIHEFSSIRELKTHSKLLFCHLEADNVNIQHLRPMYTEQKLIE
jgi:hypothetical protein